MSALDPYLTPGGEIAVDPLNEEARDRKRRRRRRWQIVLLVILLATAIAYASFRVSGAWGGGVTRLGLSADRPAGLPHQPGWYVGQAHVSTPGCSRCVRTASWASTIPYLDRPNDFPQRTMVQLGPHDMIVSVTRQWQPSVPKWMLTQRPLQIVPAGIRAGFEGNPTHGRVSQWWSSTWRSGSFVTAYVFFGSPRPTEADVARAEQELAKAKFPLWSPRRS